MADIIHLLPDSVANQIAAGEVIQRPASVVKELLENSVDAGATDIKLIVKDAGRTLIQVMDNGKGMSETDARLSFERHATSKIKNANDLFAIKTMGFRGEALASIAAIAHVELKTKRTTDELGTSVIIEGSELVSQEACACSPGASFSIKNIFYNVPARRNFLKSELIETNHILEEFSRVAMAHPHIAFQLFHNDKEVYQLQAGTLKQRIIGIQGKNFNDKLITVEEQTENIAISGFVGKPEFAKKTRGEQYFFVNNRFIKHPYLHHAVLNAFEELIPASTHPAYFIFFTIDPATIDINIHPTKTEIKFRDERLIYAMLRSSVRHALGKSNITPTLDFEREQGFDLPSSYKNKPVVPPVIKVDPNYNPFKEFQKISRTEKNNRANWEELYAINSSENKTIPEEKINSSGFVMPEQPVQQRIDDDHPENMSVLSKDIIQINQTYIVASLASGLIIIHQQYAHERILYERFLEQQENKETGSQQQLFPETIEFSVSDAELIREIINELRLFGFEMEMLSGNTFVVNGVPALTKPENAKSVLENILENFKFNLKDIHTDKKNNIALSMAKSMAVNAGISLEKEEMIGLIDELFACKRPYSSPTGKPTLTIIEKDEIDRKFRN